MPEDRLAQIIRASADQMLTDFNRTRAIQHQGQMGAAREDPVLKFLQERLPGNVNASGSAEVIDTTGATSQQMDIVIVDPSTRPFLDEQRHRIYPAECVHGVVEVKSRLNKHEVLDACEKIASVKALRKSSFYRDGDGRSVLALDGTRVGHFPTLGYVFAYEASTKIETLSSNVIEWCEGRSPSLWPDAIFILGRGTITWFVDGKARGMVVSQAVAGYVETRHPRDVLLYMSITMHQTFVNSWMPNFNLTGYLPTAVLGSPQWVTEPAPSWPTSEVPPDSPA